MFAITANPSCHFLDVWAWIQGYTQIAMVYITKKIICATYQEQLHVYILFVL